MKRPKIILYIIAVFAVIGGTLAFKANKFLPPNVYKSYLTTINGMPTIRCRPCSGKSFYNHWHLGNLLQGNTSWKHLCAAYNYIRWRRRSLNSHAGYALINITGSRPGK